MTPEERDKFMYERGQRDMQRRCAEIVRAGVPIWANGRQVGVMNDRDKLAAAIEALDVEGK